VPDEDSFEPLHVPDRRHLGHSTYLARTNTRVTTQSLEFPNFRWRSSSARRFRPSMD
jgi:hypothetical protein